MKAKRMKFIAELKDMIAQQLVRQGINELQIKRAFALWEDGNEPETPTDRGCFEVFRTIQRQIDTGA